MLEYGTKNILNLEQFYERLTVACDFIRLNIYMENFYLGFRLGYLGYIIRQPGQ